MAKTCGLSTQPDGPWHCMEPAIKQVVRTRIIKEQPSLQKLKQAFHYSHTVHQRVLFALVLPLQPWSISTSYVGASCCHYSHIVHQRALLALVLPLQPWSISTSYVGASCFHYNHTVHQRALHSATTRGANFTRCNKLCHYSLCKLYTVQYTVPLLSVQTIHGVIHGATTLGANYTRCHYSRCKLYTVPILSLK